MHVTWDQIRDSARSAPSNIAEGFSRFRPVELANRAAGATTNLMKYLRRRALRSRRR
jgi:hypothetical protein